MLTEEIVQSISECEGFSDWKRATCYSCVDSVGTKDRKKSFGYKTSSGQYICHRCGVKGYDRKREAQELNYNVDEVIVEKSKIEPPEGYIPFSDKSMLIARSTEKARNYLMSRGVPKETWLAAELGITTSGKHKNRIVVPVKGLNDEWLGWQARVWYKTEGLKYINAAGMDRQNTLFNLKALHRDTEEVLLVVEGTFDALPYYPNACAVLGKPTRGQLRLLATVKRPVVFALDGDAWLEGRAAYMTLKLYGKHNVGFVRIPPGEDPNTVDKGWLIDESNKSIEGSD